jgi:hypothetical protein
VAQPVDDMGQAFEHPLVVSVVKPNRGRASRLRSSAYNLSMPVKVLRYEPTPNPNAIKCVLSAKVADASRSFRTAESAAGNPLATALFALDGVAGVLMLNDWITVNKRPDAAWPPIKKALEKALAAYPA